jgi:23S rRNA pseudouridine2605 synthase
MKLLLFISHSGTLSRRKAFEAIQEGVVTVNGEKKKEPSFEIDPDKDKVLVQGRPVDGKRFEYVLLNKPLGYVTTCEGQFKQRTVMDLLPKELQHVRPVGRLDKETEGLLLLTNDGDLAHRLMHPAFDVDKTYSARVRWYFTPQSAEKLEQGIILFGERTAPAHVNILGVGDKESEIEITIHEGKKRQVRLMLDAVGNPVVHLKRLRQGSLLLGSLPTGEWRRLTEDELTGLRHIKPASKFPEPEKRTRSFDRQKSGERSGGDRRPGRPFVREGQANGFRSRPYRDPVVTRDDRPAGEARAPYREERAPRERAERSFSEGKPAFSSHSDQRRYSSTRQWHSPSDAHRPAEGAEGRPVRRGDDRPDFRSRKPFEDRSSASARPPYRSSDAGRPGQRSESRPPFRSAPREQSERPFSRDGARDLRSRPSYGDRSPAGARPSYGDRPVRRDDDRPAFKPRKPFGDRPASGERPSYGKPSFGKPAFGKPAFGKPAYGKPSFGKPAFGKPSFGKPAFGKPPFGKPSSGKPSFGKPASGKPAFGKPAFGKSASGKPSFGKKTFNKKPYNKPSY